MKILKFIVAICCVLALTICYAPKLNIVYAEEGVSAVAETETLPLSYNANYNDLDYVTPAKSQGNFGLCWAFATIACAEADAIKNHSAPNDLDLSEWHLAYFAYQGERANTGDSVSPVDGVNYYEVGGYDYLSACVLSSWVGLADESVAPYSVLEEDRTATLPQDKMDDSSYYIKNVLMYDVKEQPDLVKKAIMQYGAVAVSYNASTSYLNSLTYSQYCSNTSLVANHEVVIVGWDDDYSRNNFKFMNRPSSNGAWLVRNSWGANWGLNGYFWLSYEDVTLTGGTVFDVVPNTEYDYNYQHDGGVSQSYMDNASFCSPVANVFTANGEEVIEGVGVATLDGVGDAKFDDDGIPYSLKIYVNPNSLPTGNVGFEFTNLVHEQEGVFLAEGFSTIDLTKDVYLKEGDVFVAVIDTDAYIACDMTSEIKAYDANGNLLTLANSNATCAPGQSYYTNSNGVWRDAGVRASYPFNVRVKVFTSLVQKGVATVSSNPTVSAIYYGQKISDITIIGGQVIDSITGWVLDGVWSISNSNTTPINGEVLTLIFTPSDSDYSAVSVEVLATVLAVTPTINIDGFSREINAGDEVNFTYNLTNIYNENIVVDGDVKVYYKIGDSEPLLIDGNTFVAPDTDEILTAYFIFEFTPSSENYTAITQQITVTIAPIIDKPNADDPNADVPNTDGSDNNPDVNDPTVGDDETVDKPSEGENSTPDSDNKGSNAGVGFSCAMSVLSNDILVAVLPFLTFVLFVTFRKKEHK